MPDSIQITRILIQGKRTPYSKRFHDVYFAGDSGIDESNYIYLEGTRLAERMKLQATGTHVIGEVGFGVGLNFLLTLQLFKREAPEGLRLHYFSAEQYPVHLQDLRTLYHLYPELQSESTELLAQYPVLTPGIHTLRFFGGRVTLSLLIGSAEAMFQHIETSIQTWYWDGFSPKNNPDAFSESLFQVLARRSAAGAIGASFTSATWVRRGIEAAGFRITKRLGFGNKRECIEAERVGEIAMAPAIAPWFDNRNLKRAKPGQDRVAIVGAGLAGSAIARALAIRGFQVTVYDPKGIATRASGNKAALFNVQFSRQPNPISRFAQASLVHFLRELREYSIPVSRGILRADAANLEALKNSQFPDDFYELRNDGIYLPECGFLNPIELCRTRLDHPQIEFKTETWIHGSSQAREYDHVVYAQGADLNVDDQVKHPWLQALPTRPIRGQILELHPSATSRGMECTRVNHGYVTPIYPEITGDEIHLLGATYQAKNIAENQESLDQDVLITEAKTSWPEFSDLNSGRVKNIRVGYRLSTPDKLPLIGPVVDPEWLKQNYASVLKGARSTLAAPSLHSETGEWCLLGLGSRGVTYSSLGAEILASIMVGDPLPIELDLWPHLHSARFFIRKLRKSAVD